MCSSLFKVTFVLTSIEVSTSYPNFRDLPYLAVAQGHASVSKSLIALCVTLYLSGTLGLVLIYRVRVFQNIKID